MKYTLYPTVIPVVDVGLSPKAAAKAASDAKASPENVFEDPNPEIKMLF